MGEVYQAQDLNLGRLIAIKFLSPGLAGDERAMIFFKREARAAAALNHPSIVTIFDFGLLSGRPFITMEYVDGTDLATRLAEQGPLQEGHAVAVMIQVAQALHYAHERKVIHRDVKPSNIIQARGGGVKILDFGLAKALHPDKRGTSVVAGTPEYMPPEQLAGGEMDGRTDLFSLGVTLYEILSGCTPFEGALRTPEVAPPSAQAPWLSPSLDAPILRAIALDPEDRFQSGNQFAAALRKALKAASTPATSA
jgi:serine/threonine-protein kinase